MQGQSGNGVSYMRAELFRTDPMVPKLAGRVMDRALKISDLPDLGRIACAARMLPVSATLLS
jgi:hypothetical protein